ncbi:MAG: ATP-binding protein [Planctomycetota bacterium]
MGPVLSPNTSNDSTPTSATPRARWAVGAALGLPIFTVGLAGLLLWPSTAEAGFPVVNLIAGAALVLGTVAQALLLRHVFGQLATLALVGEALGDFRHHEADPTNLRITAHSDPRARAWNRIVDELAEARERSLAQDTHRALTAATLGTAERDGTLDALPHGVVIVNPDGNLHTVNGAACRMLMRGRERLVGAPLDKLTQDRELLTLVDRILKRTDVRGGSVEMVLSPGEDAEAVVRATVRPLGQNSAQHALVVFEDVTQQRTADRSRNLFVAQATHELRTPLTNIGLYLERVIDLDDHDTADRAECLNVINSEVLRLGRVVEEVLSVSEIEAGSLQVRRDDVRMEELFARLQEEYGPQAQKLNHTLTFDLPPKLPVVHGDRDKVALALHNLLGNALKYTPAGGTVRVAVRDVDGQIEVAVADSGIGIGERDLANVFDKFYRSDDQRAREVPGSGLGLALAREVIRLHGGDITVDSILNEGSTFTLRLPVRAPAAAA